MRKVLLTGASVAVNDDPAYSCDGAHVSSDQDIGASAPSVHSTFIANADGSGAHRLPIVPRTKDAYDTQSQWSPDGKRLAWMRVKHNKRAAGFAVNVDGTGPRQLTPWNLDAANPDSRHGIRQARLSRATLKGARK
jgi:dipeptidyl aminopeptidase/acylaminoacyl peptidase